MKNTHTHTQRDACRFNHHSIHVSSRLIDKLIHKLAHSAAAQCVARSAGAVNRIRIMIKHTAINASRKVALFCRGWEAAALSIYECKDSLSLSALLWCCECVCASWTCHASFAWIIGFMIWFDLNKQPITFRICLHGFTLHYESQQHRK